MKETHAEALIVQKLEELDQLMKIPLWSEQQKKEALISIQHLKNYEAPSWSAMDM